MFEPPDEKGGQPGPGVGNLDLRRARQQLTDDDPGTLAKTQVRIVEAVRRAVNSLSGADRIVTAIMVALQEIRSDPLGQWMFTTMQGTTERAWLTESPIVARFATDLNGLTGDDTEAVQWIVRVVLSLLYWPVGDAEVERHMVERFVSPAFGP